VTTATLKRSSERFFALCATNFSAQPVTLQPREIIRIGIDRVNPESAKGKKIERPAEHSIQVGLLGRISSLRSPRWRRAEDFHPHEPALHSSTSDPRIGWLNRGASVL
jgi:hypothetical protein